MLRTSQALLVLVATLAVAAVIPSGAVDAGGLYVSEFATSDMGAAGSGMLTGGASRAGSSLVNPAATTRVDSHSLTLGLAPGVAIVKFDQDNDARNDSGNGGNQGGFIPLLSAGYVHKIHDRVRLNFGAFSISGASLNPSNDWSGRAEVTEISLFTLSFFPSVGVRVTDWLSVGVGPFITYATLDWDLRVQSPVPGNEIDLRLENLDDWGVAGVAGVLIEPTEDLRLGLIYQSKTDLRLSGKGEGSSPLGLNPNVKLDLDLPQAVRGDLWWQAADKLGFSVGAAWENWSSLEDTNLSLGSSGSQSIRLGFKDSWKLRGGIHYQLTDKTLVQTGVSYDSSALRNKDRIAALPIDEQWRWGIGGIYQWTEGTRIGYSFQWTHLGTGNLRTSNVKGEYEKNDIFFFQVSLNFSDLPWNNRGTF